MEFAAFELTLTHVLLALGLVLVLAFLVVNTIQQCRIQAAVQQTQLAIQQTQQAVQQTRMEFKQFKEDVPHREFSSGVPYTYSFPLSSLTTQLTHFHTPTLLLPAIRRSVYGNV
jgi:hypothetical protein